jgi:diguanylate cyclase
MRARAWQVYLVVGTLAVVGYFLLPDDWWQTGANAAIGLAGAAGLLVGVRLHRPRRAGLWWMLAGGLVCIAAGDLVYALYERYYTARPRSRRWPTPSTSPVVR